MEEAEDSREEFTGLEDFRDPLGNSQQGLRSEQPRNMDDSAYLINHTGALMSINEDLRRNYAAKDLLDPSSLNEVSYVGNRMDNMNLNTSSSCTNDAVRLALHQEYSDEEELRMNFETDSHRPNDLAAYKLLQVADDIGLEEERSFKKLIKKYSERQNQRVESIEGLRLAVDSFYPRVRLFYELNGKEEDNDMITVFAGSHNREQQNRSLFKRLYDENFVSLDKQGCKKLFPVLSYRQKYTQKKFVGELDASEPNGLSKTLAAVYSMVPNATVQFVFIDVCYSQVEFNSFFLEKYRDRFPEAYDYYLKVFLPRLVYDPSGRLIDLEEPAIDVEDSDEERIATSKRVTVQNVVERLVQLFEEDLAPFQKVIENRIGEFEVQNRRKERKEDELAVLAESLMDRKRTLQDYRSCREVLMEQHELLQRSKEVKQRSNSQLASYKKLRMLRNQLQSQLPIVARKRELFERLRSTNLLILEGETGSGKSTQLPQLLCEFFDIFTNSEAKPIVITQPRKLATRTLAERIAFELNEAPHGFVDYCTVSNRRTNPRSKILVKLDRLLLDELETDPLLSKYSCLILDEAHERTLSIDVIVGFVQNILEQRKEFKIVLTSATLDASLFEKYFKVDTLKVSGRLYPVEVLYRPYPKFESAEDKIYQCLQQILSLPTCDSGHILVFCAGVDEINRLCEKMRAELTPARYLVLPLHGRLSPEEQQSVFLKSSKKQKIIFSTRIAETSVTIDQVKVVIDPGSDRINVYDQKNKISSFVLRPISQSAAKQRAGRAGRTTHGYCYRLYSEQFEKEMNMHKLAEIQSIPLDILVLRLKSLRIRKLLNFPYLAPPNKSNLKASIESMRFIGCLNSKEQLTPLGRAIVKIPMQPFLSKAIIEAKLVQLADPSRKVLEGVVKILALVINSNGLFYSTEETRENCERAKFHNFADEQGDFFSLLNLYEAFETKTNRGERSTFLRDNFVSRRQISQVRDLVRELTGILGSISISNEDFEEELEKAREHTQQFSDDRKLILGCLVPSFCQNIALFSGNPHLGYTLISSGQAVDIYGSSFLSLQGIQPKWIICFELFETERTSRTFCRVAQEVSFEMLRQFLPEKIFERLQLEKCEDENPYYQEIYRKLPTLTLNQLQANKTTLSWLWEGNFSFNFNCNLFRWTHPSTLDGSKKLKLFLRKFTESKMSEDINYMCPDGSEAVLTHDYQVRQLIPNRHEEPEPSKPTCSQEVIEIPDYVLKILQEGYQQLKSNVLKTHSIELTEIEYQYLAIIFAKGPEKRGLVTAVSEVRQFFSSFLLRLQPKIVRTLNNIWPSQGTKKLYELVFREVERQFLGEVCFEYYSNKQQMRVYCRKRELSQKVSKVLQEQILQLEGHSIETQYRGSNIHRVLELANHLGGVEVELRLAEKRVHVYGKIEDVVAFQEEMDKLNGDRRQRCLLCGRTNSLPYQLSCCRHTFCTNCLVSYLRRTSITNTEPRELGLKCPYESCTAIVSLHDLWKLLDDEEYEYVCNQIVLRFVAASSVYFKCITPKCVQLFKKVATTTFATCQLCEQTYCLSCMAERHQGLTCSERRNGVTLEIKQQRIKKEQQEVRRRQEDRIRLQKQLQEQRVREQIKNQQQRRKKARVEEQIRSLNMRQERIQQQTTIPEQKPYQRSPQEKLIKEKKKLEEERLRQLETILQYKKLLELWRIQQQKMLQEKQLREQKMAEEKRILQQKRAEEKRLLQQQRFEQQRIQRQMKLQEKRIQQQRRLEQERIRMQKWLEEEPIRQQKRLEEEKKRQEARKQQKIQWQKGREERERLWLASFNEKKKLEETRQQQQLYQVQLEKLWLSKLREAQSQTKQEKLEKQERRISEQKRYKRHLENRKLLPSSATRKQTKCSYCNQEFMRDSLKENHVSCPHCHAHNCLKCDQYCVTQADCSRHLQGKCWSWM